MENENIAEPVLLGQLKSYAEIRLKLEKFKAVKNCSPTAANVIIYVIAACSLILGFSFGSVTLAFYLGELLGSLMAGFGTVAALYIGFGILLLLSKKTLQKPIVNVIIKKSCN